MHTKRSKDAKGPKKRMNLRVPGALLDRIEKEAAKTGLTMTRIMERAAEAYLARKA